MPLPPVGYGGSAHGADPPTRMFDLFEGRGKPPYHLPMSADSMRILAILLVVALAGCFGLPAGGADFGDTVTVNYVAMDPETGELLASRLDQVPTARVDGERHYQGPALRSTVAQRLASVPSDLQSMMQGDSVPKAAFDQALEQRGLLSAFGLAAEFELGSGESPLGFAAEQQIAGMRANETRTFEAGGAGGYTGTQSVARIVDGGAFVQDIPLNEFEFFFHPDPEPGQEFEYNILHEARVEAVEGNTVRIRVLAEEGQTAPADFVGVTIETHVNETGYHYELVPQTGTRFVVQPAQGQGGTPLNLPPGGYRTRGVEGDQIVYDYTPDRTTLVDRDVRYVVELVGVAPVEDAVPTGDYGKRRSPVLAGHGHDAEDDGHADHSH